jgi:hypothetical protein
MYAMNRHYSSQFMRFTSPDPYQASGGPADPQSWNRYAYVKGDPVNSNDPTGLLASFCSAEFSYSQCGGDSLFWNASGGGGGGGGSWEFGDGYAEAQQQGYTPGMPSSIWSALQQYNQGVQATYEAIRATAAYRSWDFETANQIAAAYNGEMTFEFHLPIAEGSSYQQKVDAYLKAFGIWDFIEQSTMRWQGNGYTFRFANLRAATDYLKGNPDFASGFLGLLHVDVAGWPNIDFRSWNSDWAGGSLQVTVGGQGVWADVDRFNPYSVVGFIEHGIFEVLPPIWKRIRGSR